MPIEVLQSDPDHLVDAAINYLATDEFRRRLVAFEAVPVVNEVVSVIEALHKGANRLARADVRDYATDPIIDSSYNHDPSDLSGQHERVRHFVGLTSNGVRPITLKEYLLTKHIEGIYHTQEHQAAQQGVLEKLQTTRMLSNAWLDNWLYDLRSRRYEPVFLRAADCWTNTPTSQGDRGSDGHGYNGGIIHFFEYRADPDKNRRFKAITEEASVDGFITFTSRVRTELENCGHVGDERRVVLEDSEGNRRFYILLDDGEFIVGFQKNEALEPKLASVITGVTDHYFRLVVDNCLAGHDRGKLNKLGSRVTRLYIKESLRT